MDTTKITHATAKIQALALADLMDTYEKSHRKNADIQANILRVRENLERLVEAQAELQRKREKMQSLLTVLTPEENAFVLARMEHASLSRKDMCKRLKMSPTKTDVLWRSAVKKMVLALEYGVGAVKA